MYLLVNLHPCILYTHKCVGLLPELVCFTQELDHFLYFAVILRIKGKLHSKLVIALCYILTLVYHVFIVCNLLQCSYVIIEMLVCLR